MRFFLRMYPVFHRSMMGLSLNTYSGRLPKWGSMRNGDIYEHRIVERRTSANGGSAWPTPSSMEMATVGTGRLYTTENGTIRRMNADGTSSNMGLSHTVRAWATPTVDDADNVTRASGQFHSLTRDVVSGWRPPTASDANTHPNDTMRYQSTASQLHAMGQLGQLNPSWVELLMGFPVGWTSLDGLPVQVNYSMITNRRASRPAERPTGQRGLRRSVTPSCRKLSTRYSWR